MAKKLTLEQQIENQIVRLKKEQESLKKLKEKNAMNMGKIAMKYFDSADDLKRFLKGAKANGYLQSFFDAVATKKTQQSVPVKPVQTGAKIDANKTDNMPF